MRKLILAGALLAMGAANANAALFTVSGTGAGGQTISASAEFTIVGGNLQIVLTNTAGAAASSNANLLSAVFFNIANAGAVTAVGGNATSNGLLQSDGTVDPGAAADLNDFWSFDTGASLGGNSYGFGLGGAGFGIFGGNDTFTEWNGGSCGPGTACQGEPNGPPYLIAPSAGATVPASQFPLTNVFATFVLPITSDFDINDIQDVTLAWGTRPEYYGTDGGSEDGGGGIDGGTSPEPATLALLGLALTVGAAQMRRRNRK